MYLDQVDIEKANKLGIRETSYTYSLSQQKFLVRYSREKKPIKIVAVKYLRFVVKYKNTMKAVIVTGCFSCGLDGH